MTVTYLPTERQRFRRGGCIQTGDSAVLNSDTCHSLDGKQVRNGDQVHEIAPTFTHLMIVP